VRTRLLPLGALLAAVAAWAAFTLSSPPGPGLDPDAMSYLGSAQSLAAGQGLRIPSAPWHASASTAPLAHFPPGYPLAMAVGVGAGLTPATSARVIMAVAAAATVVAVLLVLEPVGTIAAGVLAVLVLLFTPAMTVVHASVLSEPLYLAITALALWRLARLERTTRDWLLLGVLGVAAVMVRYAGASLVLAAVLDAWLIGGTLRLRFTRMVTVAALPVGALAGWMLSRVREPNTEAIRKSALYLANWDRTFAEGWTTICTWLAPGITSVAVASVVALGVIAALVTLAVRELRSSGDDVHGDALLRAIGLMAVSYVAVVLASRLLADGEIPLDERLLAPLGLVLTIGAVHVLVRWVWEGGRVRASFVGVLLLAWFTGATVPVRALLAEYRGDGGDLASTRWRTSGLVQYARTHADTLYSNEMSALWFHTGRAVHELPVAPSPATIAAFRAKLAREDGALLAWEFGDAEVTASEALIKGAGLVAVQHDSTGTVWKVPVERTPTGPIARP
jgi:hypothetical protein